MPAFGPAGDEPGASAFDLIPSSHSGIIEALSVPERGPAALGPAAPLQRMIDEGSAPAHRAPGLS
jgi:hypothetical protein